MRKKTSSENKKETIDTPQDLAEKSRNYDINIGLLSGLIGASIIDAFSELLKEEDKFVGMWVMGIFLCLFLLANEYNNPGKRRIKTILLLIGVMIFMGIWLGIRFYGK